MARRLGLDRAIAFTLLGHVWRLVAGPVTLFLIALAFTPEEQGFYYVFASMLAMQIFFELGASQVILQFASHEKAHLEWSPAGTLEGEPGAKARLRSLFRLAVGFYAAAAVLFVLLLLPLGMAFFSANQPGAQAIDWQIPWALVVLATGGSLCLGPVFAVLEGCGRVQEVAKYRLAQGVVASSLAWSALALDAGLYVASANIGGSLLFGLGWLFFRHRAMLRDMSAPPEGARIDWWREIWPFQWRIAVSWLSGYFSYHLFNPILFASAGAREAGQMGMSLAIASAVSAVAFAWVNTKVPRFGALVARRDFGALDRLFFPSLAKAFAIFAAGGSAYWLVNAWLHHAGHPLAARMLAPLPLALLLGAMAVNIVTFSLGAYLRAHKEEPFLWMSVLGGLGIALTAYWGAQAWGATGMLLGYFLINLGIGLGGGSVIFLRKRRQWHKEDPHGPDDRDPHLQPQRHAAGERRAAAAPTDA